MPNTTTVIVGAGHCGLAMSHCLAARSIDHVVLERGEVANSWRTQRWDSLRLLTPNWMTRLPGYAYRGADPDGYLSARQVTAMLEDYAGASAAPVLTGTTVTSVRAAGGGYVVRTDQGSWRAPTVVLACGAATVPAVPALARLVPAGITSVTPAGYRNPGELPDGGVLVVGASASGVQLADELHRSGRPVTLAVGEHVRMPRTYRGRDILWWLDASGLLDQRYDEAGDLVRARNVPSMQLVGSPGRTVDLNALSSAGVRLAGRLAGIADGVAQFSGSLPNVCALADLKLGRLLNTIDAWAGAAGERFAPTIVPTAPLGLDLRSGEISTIVWATGYRPDLSWLDVPVLDRRGRVVHDGGVTACPGLYLIGMPFLRRRKSSLIDGAAGDAAELTSAPRRPPRRTGRPPRKERVMNEHPQATAIAAAVAGRDSAPASRCGHRHRPAAGAAARRPDRRARPRCRRRPLRRMVRRHGHRRPGGVGRRGGGRPAADPLPAGPGAARHPLGLHPDLDLQDRRRPAGHHRPALLRLPRDLGWSTCATRHSTRGATTTETTRTRCSRRSRRTVRCTRSRWPTGTARG